MKTLPAILLFIFSVSLAKAQLPEDSITIPYKYLIYTPKEKPASGKYPLLLFLHGSGERGNDLKLLQRYSLLSFYKDTAKFPFLLIMPQCPAGQRWSTEILIRLLDEIEKKYPIDKEREYLTGLSMGGFGCWALAKVAGDRFAAMAPVCGGGDTINICMARHIPTWAFHGTKDTDVPVAQSIKMVKALQDNGGQATLTLYEGMGHNSWDSAYADPRLYEWFLKHKRLNEPIALTEKEKKAYVGSYVYTNTDGSTLDISIQLENGELWHNVPKNNFKVKMYMVDTDLFRLEGVAYEGDSKILFVRNKKGKVIGQRYYPCDRSWVPKVE